ncbi:MAG: Uncharacterized protein Greene041619_125 [Candidatus Peregrinibacteria bacterium Greene0416_19]|nr:MAG: Uncharacterized protein Greene041619_125 [Candidatus Peregrinibacteria bacterium Greene0416_19]
MLYFTKNRPGVLLLEILLGLAVFLIFLGSVGLILMNGQANTKSSGDRVRGTEISKQALEAVRSVRDASFSSLPEGSYGVRVDAMTGKWSLVVAPSSSSGGYLTTVTINQIASDQVVVTAKTTWQRDPSRKGEITLTSILTDWRVSKPVRKWGTFTVAGSYVFLGGGVGCTASNNPLLNDVVRKGNYAFVTSDQGQGLYIFDVSNPASVSLAACFNLNAAGYGVGIRGRTLYVLTNDTSAELKALDITVPTSPTLLASYNLPDPLPGGKGPRALLVDGNLLFIGATDVGPMAQRDALRPVIARGFLRRLLVPGVEAIGASSLPGDQGCIIYDGENYVPCSSSSSTSAGASSSASIVPPPTGNDLFVFDISIPSQLRFMHSIYANGVNGIALTGTSAYLASPNDTAEVRVANVKNPWALTFATGSVNGAPNGGYNMNDRTVDALTATTAKSFLLVGTDKDQATQEIVLFDVRNGGVPPAGSGPWYQEGSGSVVKAAMDPTGCYGFIVTDGRLQTLQVVKVRDYSLQKLLTWGTSTPQKGGRGMQYDAANDLLYLTTKDTFYVFQPGSSPNDCE